MVFFLLVIVNLSSPAMTWAQPFDRSAFYAVMAASYVDDVDAQLKLLKNASIKEKEAYEGALLMKKAGLVVDKKNKLSLFKSGRKKLDKALSTEADNPEYRFLRLMIQEHAPKILNYNMELNDDSQFIGKFFKKLSPAVQKAVIDYSRKSKVLNPELL